MIRLIGCGNGDAGDDAVGLLVARAARDRLGTTAGVEVVEAGPALNAVAFLEDVDAAVIVDAVRTAGGGRPAGEIVRVEAGSDGLPLELGASLSSHGFGVGEAVAVARALGSTTPIVVLGVEAEDPSPGRRLSPRVAAALPRLTDIVVSEVVALAPITRGAQR